MTGRAYSSVSEEGLQHGNVRRRVVCWEVEKRASVFLDTRNGVGDTALCEHVVVGRVVYKSLELS